MLSFFYFAVMPNFAQRVQMAVDALSSNPPKDVDENEFIDASRLVYEGVREIRRAVLMNRVSGAEVKIVLAVNIALMTPTYVLFVDLRRMGSRRH